MSKTYRLEYTQVLPVSLERAWDFFSQPDNLPHITPPYMRFTVTSPAQGQSIYPGQIITYTLRPVLGIPMRWVTEITHVRDKEYFVDEQRAGPYRMWHHEHHFQEVEAGVLMKDIVHYQIPFGPLGRFANFLFVQRQLESLFAFRRQQTAALR